MKWLFKHIILFCVGGFVYLGIELFARGYSHISMWLLGGTCFVLIGQINEFVSWDLPLVAQMGIGAVIITVLEFLTGCIVNLWLGLEVWDYSDLPLNLMGQICLPFSAVWFFISALAIFADDYLRYKWFGEKKPKYRIFK